MITAPLTVPKPGLILFSERLALMVYVGEVFDDGFAFHVINGAWIGEVRNGRVLDREMEHPGRHLGRSDFVEVLSVSRDEYHAWYLDVSNAATGADKLIDRAVAAAPVLAGSTDDETPEEGPELVFEVTLRVSVLGQASSARELETWVAGMSLADLAHQMDEGELIGASQVIATSEIPSADVRARLEEIGNDGSFFEHVAPAGEAVPVSERIGELRDRQGWGDGRMENLAADFIREAGLERAFLAHLERQAAEGPPPRPKSTGRDLETRAEEPLEDGPGF